MDTNRNKICILIPTMNRRPLLERALQSVFDQTVVPDEIIVVNDGSTDDTSEFLREIAEAHRNVQVITQPKNKGVNAARNAGIRISNSDWIAWLDDDDEFLPDAVAMIREEANRAPSSVNVLSFCAFNDDGKTRFKSGYQFNEGEEYHDLTYEEVMTKRNLKGEGRLVFRRKLFDDTQYLFDESVNGFESSTFSVLIRDHKGWRCVNRVSTLIHIEKDFAHASDYAFKAAPATFLKVHSLQLVQHWRFYVTHPSAVVTKARYMLSLLVASIKKLIGLR